MTASARPRPLGELCPEGQRASSIAPTCSACDRHRSELRLLPRPCPNVTAVTVAGQAVRYKRTHASVPNQTRTANPMETTMRKFVLAIAITAAFGGAAAAHPLDDERSGCDDFGCGTSNGTKLTGIARPSVVSRRPVVTAVKLPSGETVHLHR